jgi:hypothetical protein
MTFESDGRGNHGLRIAPLRMDQSIKGKQTESYRAEKVCSAVFVAAIIRSHK